MFTDMVGFSARAQADETEALSALDEHNRLLRSVFSKFHGREIKTAGDSFLIEFESALDAVRCALEIQESLHARNQSVAPPEQIQVRIGVHVGDVVQTGADVLGDAVNIAARIQELAPPGEICITQQVFDQVQNKLATPIVRLPAVRLKNIATPPTVYQIQPSGGAIPTNAPVAVPGGGHDLAVLPLANISPDPKDEYFADGLTEELITTLSQVQDLRVIARTSVVPYKSAPRSVAVVGAELGVDTILEGSVRKAGSRIRITLQLVDVRTQRHIWATSYDRELDDVFAVQTDISARTAEALKLQLLSGSRETARRRSRVDPEAYDLYLRGLVAANESGGAGLEESSRWFERATQLDPEFAEAYAAWANQYVVAAGDFVSMREVMPRARQLAAHAIELDPESSEAHAALGNIALQFDHAWARAEAEFQKAIAFNPSNVTAHRFYGMMLMAQERFSEAREVFRRATRLDPAGGFRANLAWVELEEGNFGRAIELVLEDCQRHPDSVGAHVALGLNYLTAGRKAEALHEAEFPLTGANHIERFDHALLNGLLGRPGEARAVLEAVDRGEFSGYLSWTDLAMLHCLLGEKAKALDLLEKDLREGDQLLWLTYRGLFFDPIRDDPRFLALLHEYGLPTHRLNRMRHEIR